MSINRAHQVDGGWDCEGLDEAKKERRGMKRALVLDAAGSLPPDAERQKSWLNRNTGEEDTSSWRPATVHRTSART